MATVLKCHVGIGPRVQGEALVASDNFSARYDLDRIKGVFSRPEHALAGQSYVGKIIVLNTAKGGVASAWMLYEMASRGLAPSALLLNTACQRLLLTLHNAARSIGHDHFHGFGLMYPQIEDHLAARAGRIGIELQHFAGA